MTITSASATTAEVIEPSERAAAGIHSLFARRRLDDGCPEFLTDGNQQHSVQFCRLPRWHDDDHQAKDGSKWMNLHSPTPIRYQPAATSAIR